MTRRHLLLFFLALVCLAQSASLIKWIAAPVFVLGMWRMWIASACFLPLVLRERELKPLFQSKKSSLLLLGLSGLFLFLHFWTYFYSAKNTQVAHCMIIFATNPLFTALGAALFFREKITYRLIISYVLAATSVWLLVAQSLDIDRGSVLGDLSALVSAILYSAYFLMSFKARKEYPNKTFTLVVFTISALCFTAFSFSENNWINYPTQTWIGLFLLGGFTTVLGHGLFNYLVKFINMNVLACGKLVEPAIASLTAFLLFREIPTGMTILAYVASALSLLVLFFPLAVLVRAKQTKA